MCGSVLDGSDSCGHTAVGGWRNCKATKLAIQNNGRCEKSPPTSQRVWSPSSSEVEKVKYFKVGSKRMDPREVKGQLPGETLDNLLHKHRTFWATKALLISLLLLLSTMIIITILIINYKLYQMKMKFWLASFPYTQ